MTYKSGSSKVKVQGRSWAHLGSATAYNGSNASAPAGAHVAPSQTVVRIAP